MDNNSSKKITKKEDKQRQRRTPRTILCPCTASGVKRERQRDRQRETDREKSRETDRIGRGGLR